MSQGKTTRRLSGLPLYAGASATVYADDPVTVSGVWGVVSIEDAETRVDGVARAKAVNKDAVDVRNTNDIIRGVAAATIAAGNDVGFSTAASGAVEFGPVAAASGSAVWTVGVAVEHANPGEEFGYIFSPRQLSGLA